MISMNIYDILQPSIPVFRWDPNLNFLEASEATITDERYNRRVEEEAISKLERLGYPRNLAKKDGSVIFLYICVLLF